MLSLEINLKDAENAIRKIKSEGLYDYSRLPERKEQTLIIPLLKKENRLLKDIFGSKFIKKKLKNTEKIKNYKDYLKERISKKEIKELPTACDIIGDILILELKNNKNEKLIGDALLKANKNIRTILKKEGIHQGEFRTQHLKYVAGEKKKETLYRENNTSIKLNVEKVYFSPRLSTERKRISEQVKKGEKILVMFSGCAPFPLVISKNTGANTITGIEKNPIAHKYGEENLKLNKIKNVILIKGDVKKEVPKLKQKFDRILLPLPKGAEDFLNLAFSVSKKGTTIHFYDFEHESELENGEKKAKKAAKKAKKTIKILRTIKCGQYSPGKFRICVDFVISN
jgi:tRNA (guanine37-N1)-methyltransferase